MDWILKDGHAQKEYPDPHDDQDPFGPSVVTQGVIDLTVYNAYVHFIVWLRRNPTPW